METLNPWPDQSRGFNGSVNISENCDFRSQYDPFYIILNSLLFKILFCWRIHFKRKSIK